MLRGEDFTEYREVGEDIEVWLYTLQDTYSNEKEVFYEVENKKRYKLIKYGIQTEKTWAYRATHELTYVDGAGFKGWKRPEDHYYHQVTYNEYESVITAEEMMLENSEELKRYGSPGNRKVLFTETESNHYTRDHLKQVYETGQKTVQAIKHILSPRSQSFASPGPAGKGKETNASDSWDITKKVGRGIYNFIIGDEIATLTDGQLDWNDALAIASFTPAGKIVKIGKSVTYIKSTAESLGILASKAGSKLKSGFRSARDKVTTGLKQAGDQIRSGLKQTKDKITNGISEAKEKVKNAGSKLWGGIKGLFGKKKKKPDKNNNNAIQENRVGGPGYLQTFASKGTGNPAHNVAQYQKLKKQLALEEIQSVVKTTKHGAERLIERGFTPKDISELKLNPDIVKTQSDGAEVFIKQVNGKYNVIVEGDNGVITALKNISKKSLDRLEKNYDWR